MLEAVGFQQNCWERENSAFPVLQEAPHELYDMHLSLDITRPHLCCWEAPHVSPAKGLGSEKELSTDLLFSSRRGLKILDPTVQYCYLEKQSQKRALVYIGLARNTLLGRCARAFSLHSTPLPHFHSTRGGGGRKFTSTITWYNTHLSLILPSSLYTVPVSRDCWKVFLSFFANHFGDTEQVSPPVRYSILWRNIHCRTILLYLFLLLPRRRSVPRLQSSNNRYHIYHSSSSSSHLSSPQGVIPFIGRQDGRSPSIHVYRKGGKHTYI